jgi:hypothetical protein
MFVQNASLSWKRGISPNMAMNCTIISRIRRAGEYAGDISETVINLLVENEIAPSRAKIRK